MVKNVANRKSGLVVRTGVKAGGLWANHSQNLVVDVNQRAPAGAGLRAIPPSGAGRA
jgi:hypothetical protein